MIPTRSIPVSPDLPGAAGYWTPKPSDISDEGFGFFQDVWRITGVTKAEAAEVIEIERACVDFLDTVAAGDREFDQGAEALEARDIESIELEDAVLVPIQKFIAERLGMDDFHPLGGLEVGVAGLVHALSAVHAFPAASCRGHVGPPKPWAEVPVVLFAIDRRRAEILQPLVAEAGAGFSLDATRPELLVIHAGSVTAFMQLANLIVENATRFRLPRAKRARMPRIRYEQKSLF